MARSLRGPFCLSVALSWCGSATQAEVTIDFESVPVSGCVNPGPELTTQGFSFASGGDASTLIVCDSTDPNGASNGSNWLWAVAEGGGRPVGMVEGTSWGTGQPFSLIAFDAAELSVGDPGTAIRVIATDAEGNPGADLTFPFDGVIDGPGGADDFQTFVLPAGFQNVSGVTFMGPGEDPADWMFAVDNLVVSVAEPQLPTLSPWFQLALIGGLLAVGIGTWRWRAARTS